jgi:DnaK suppressor protein
LTNLRNAYKTQVTFEARVLRLHGNKGGKNMDALTVTKFKTVLLEEKERILNNSRNSILNDFNISSDDLPDETDLAATEITQNLVFKLRDRERLLLMKITQALSRIENGNFGICMECEEAIESRRLQARPVSTFCLNCQEIQEYKDRVYA